MPDGPSKEGGGGSPHPFPSQSTMGSFSHWFLPSHVIPLFRYKNHRPISCFHTHGWSSPQSRSPNKWLIAYEPCYLNSSQPRKREKCMGDDPFFTPPQFRECPFCEKPCTIPVLLTSCCSEPCHVECTIEHKKKYQPPRTYPCCYQNYGLAECLFCLQPGKHEYTFTHCCNQVCHELCARSWKTRYPAPRPCLTVIEPQKWKEDPHFVEQVKELWKDNPFWHCFLGHNQSEVIPHMKASLSCK